MNQRNIPFLEFNSSLSNLYLNLKKVIYFNKDTKAKHDLKTILAMQNYAEFFIS